MSEMVDRVAHGIYLAGTDWTQLRDDWEDMPAAAKESHREQARAAIRAMREASHHMLEAAHAVEPNGMTGSVWRAMIDAALGGGERSGATIV